MSVVIRTDRLELRSFDAGVARSIRDERPPAGSSWIAGYPLDSSRDAAERLAHDAEGARWSPFARFQIVLRDVGQIIGDCGFEAPPGADGAVEIGYELAEAARGRHFESEAVEALIGFAFTRDEVSCVRASAALADVDARRTFQNAGMMRVGEHGGRVHFEG
jgi:RimJ/RimL family protein N-acetyltransferase